MYQLTDNDAQLLAFINKTGPTEIAKLQNKFSDIKTITLRLQTLTSRDVGFLSQKQIYHRDGAGELYREDTGIYSLTPFGDKSAGGLSILPQTPHQRPLVQKRMASHSRVYSSQSSNSRNTTVVAADTAMVIPYSRINLRTLFTSLHVTVAYVTVLYGSYSISQNRCQ